MGSLAGVQPKQQASNPPVAGRADRASPHGIFHVYGWTGVLMVSVFLLSGAWTLTLAVVQLAPSQVANALMGTTHLDLGDFWTLQKADDGIALAATVQLVAIALGYFGLVVEMLRLSRSSHRLNFRRRRSAEIHPHDTSVQSPARLVQDPRTWAARARNALRQPNVPVALVAHSDTDRGRRLWQWLRSRALHLLQAQDSPALALPKLLLQTSILFKYLRDGFPQTTVLAYASLLFLNWLISTYCAMAQLVDPRAALVRVFYSFDMFFAVYAPMQVVLYAYSYFDFDFAEFATRTDVFKTGSFEAVARLFANPAEVSLFRAAFRSLQVFSLWNLGVRIALNALTIRRWWRTIRLLSQPGVALPRPHTTHRLGRIHAAVFFAMGSAMFVYSLVAVVSSTLACERFQQCKVPSYRWNVGALECSCSVFVDCETVVRTFDEWANPVDTTANLARLAASGDLKVVQIVNRQLPTLPDELRRCTGLEQLILLYTKTITIPDWAHEFTLLEYLHIEGDSMAKQLESLPRDLFVNMPKLAFVHFGCLLRLQAVPDLDHVPQLKYLTLALLHAVTELPSFDKLVHLKRLNIVDAIHVTALPSLGALQQLTSLGLVGLNPVCCNGFLSGECDVSDKCRDPAAAPTTTHYADCTSKRMSASDRAVVAAVGSPVCKDSQLRNLSREPATREAIDGACGGVLYKRCDYRGVGGICVPSRWTALACEMHPSYEAVRRLEIQRKVGDPCDPVVEAWLGCGAH